MNAFPQIIVAALALLVLFLLGCIIGWLLRTRLIREQSKTAKVESIPPTKTSPSVQKSKPAKTKAGSNSAPKQVVEQADTVPAGKPSTLNSPRDGKKDELKKINGIGPRLEETLNKLGIYHFDQIARWNRPEIEWVDDYLSFKGRIERDGWIEQARKLSSE